VIYAKAFFDLQLQFAHKVTALSGLPRVRDHRFRHMPLWGQFLDRHGEIKENMMRQFLERLERQSTLDGLDQCFPFQVLTVEASAREFYDFYQI
jgi:hypothetical protein